MGTLVAKRKHERQLGAQATTDEMIIKERAITTVEEIMKEKSSVVGRRGEDRQEDL